MKGKIICINKYIHRVLLENNTIIDTRTRGKLRNQKVSPVVGDNVIVDINNKTIEKVEPRKNYLERPLIANIDKLLIVMSTSIPVFSDYLIDKFLLIANYNNIEPIIIITKTDMITIKEKAEVSGIKSKRYDRSRLQGFLCRRSLAQQGNRPGKIQSNKKNKILFHKNS